MAPKRNVKYEMPMCLERSIYTYSDRKEKGNESESDGERATYTSLRKKNSHLGGKVSFIQRRKAPSTLYAGAFV